MITLTTYLVVFEARRTGSIGSFVETPMRIRAISPLHAKDEAARRLHLHPNDKETRGYSVFDLETFELLAGGGLKADSQMWSYHQIHMAKRGLRPITK